MFTNNLKTHKKATRIVPLTLLGGLLAAIVVLSALFSPRPARAATTTITICSQQGTYYYNILGANAASLREKLDNPDNFGPTGYYGDFDFVYVDVGDNFTEQTILDNSCNIWYSGYESDSSYTTAELTELQNWVANNNGQVMAGCDGTFNDPVCDLLDFTVTTDTDSYGFIVERIVNPLTCDGLLDPGDELNMAGGVGGYFSGTGVTADNVLAVHETGGIGDESKPIIVYTGNFFLTADINMIQTGGTELTISAGPGVTTNNDIMTMNAFSSLADASIGNEVCTSVTVNNDNDGDGIPDDVDTDDDNDGQLDVDELACGSDPLDAASLSPDYDGDSIPDCVDTDDDNDGVADDVDAFPFSDMGATVIVNTCDSGVGNQVLDSGATFNDLIGQVLAESTDRDSLMNGMEVLLEQWLRDGLITRADKHAIVVCVRNSG